MANVENQAEENHEADFENERAGTGEHAGTQLDIFA